MREYLNIINKQVIRGNQLISNVRQLSKVENYKKSLHYIDILQVLQKSIKYIEFSFQENNLKIDFNNSIPKNSSFNGLYIQGNELLQNIFENIIFNAIYHNKSKTIHILITVLKEKLNNIQYVKIEFSDNGVGITDARKNTIFQKGYENRESKKGLGFGLTLVRKLIKNYNGMIWVEDRVKGHYNMGSKFVIMIPEICEKPYIQIQRKGNKKLRTKF